MKTKTLLIFLFFVYCSTNIFAQNWLWAKSGNGTGLDIASTSGSAVCTDAKGNVIITGSFNSPIITFGSTTLTNVGYYDIFIVKYDSSGNVIWAKSVGGAGNESGYSITTDTAGNVLVAGGFSSPILTFGSTALVNSGWSDVYIAKYDPGGNVLWAKNARGKDDDSPYCVSTDGSGNVFVTGSFLSPTLIFGSDTITNISYSTGSSDMFIVKYDANANMLWAKSEGGSKRDIGHSITTDTGGNVFVTGSFYSPTLTFGPITLANAGSFNNVFIVKYNAVGNVLWAKGAGGADYDEGTSLSTDSGGNVFVTGWFSSPTITFDSITLVNGDSGEVFIAKYNASGNILWVKSAGGSRWDFGRSVKADTEGNVFLTGDFNSPTITFGSTQLILHQGNCASGCVPMFIVKYDANGHVLCASSTVDGENSSVSVDLLGNAYIVGCFNANPFIADTHTLPLTGQRNIFTAKYRCNNNNAVNELTNEKSVSIYPNPFSVQTILLTNKFFKNATLTVYNLQGQTVQQIDNLFGQKIIFYRYNLPGGIYFIQLIQNNKIIATDKLVIIDK